MCFALINMLAKTNKQKSHFHTTFYKMENNQNDNKQLSDWLSREHINFVYIFSIDGRVNQTNIARFLRISLNTQTHFI